MLGFAGGLERAAAAAQTDDVLHFTEQPRVTANAFLPPRIPAPKAWQRVAVNPAPGHGRQSKIWKRVPGLSVSNPARDAYLRDMAELEDTRGQNPRKRVRGGSHVPAYGDARWATRPRSARLIGSVDLGEARAFVNKVNAESMASETSFSSKNAAFPDHQLSWVPRKRHNSRWPIPPNMDRATDFEIPAAAAPAESTMQVDEETSLNRSTRRLSRRFTLLPGGEESPRKLLMPRLSPAKKPAPALSPIKKAPAITMLSPIKVSDSPLRAFRIHATPTKVVLESPKTSPPEKSPSKSSPAMTTPGTMLPPAIATPRAPVPQEQDSESSVPLIFDQPVSDSVAEPQHEARRRISLTAARRTERKSLGASRLDAVRNSPNRRHSLNSLNARIAEASDNGKGRRSTLGSDFLFDVTGRKENEGVIEVDAKTNLDIFSQPSKVVASTPRREVLGAAALDETPQPSAPLDGFFSPLMTDTSGITGTAPTNDVSPQKEPKQAAGSHAPCVTDAEEEPSVLEDSAPLPASIEESPNDEYQPAETEESALQKEQADEVEETPVYEHEAAEGDISFTPYEPEGLSTIYEESTIIESPRKSPTRRSPIKTSLAAEVQETSMVVEEHEAISFIEPTVVLKASESSSIKKEHMVVAPSTPRSARVAPASPSTPLQNHDLDAVLQLSIKRSVKRSTRKEDVSRFNALDGSPSAPGLHEDSFASIDDSSELSDLSACDVDMSTDLVVTTSTTRARFESPQQQPYDSPISSPSPAEPEIDAKEEEVSLLETSPLPVAQSFESNASTVVDAVFQEAGESDPKDPVDVGKTTSPAPECDDPSLTVSSLSPQETAIVAEDEVLAPGIPAQTTPVERSEAQENVSTPEQRAGDIVNASEPSGFTPINGRQTSPSELLQPAATTLLEEIEAQSDDLDEDEVVEQDVVDEACDELTMAVDDDFTFSVPPPQVENDTIQLRARHDDSEAELLRKFVTRVTADKNAKAAAAAAAAASTTQNPRLKRRSGSMSTLASSTGSPMTEAEADTPTDRKPLGEKSPNSPSPVKKRKLEDMKDDQAKDVAAPKDAPDSPSQAPAPKRRRKRVLGSTENALDKSTPATAALPPPDDEAPRRSTRARSTRILRPTAPSANSIALSLIPVRLPGMGAMNDGTMDTHFNMARQRNEEKDLATMTRVNTRKNKGNAVHPAVILAKHAEDSSWKIKEAEPKEPRTQADRTVKNVRWAEELASYQGESPVLPAADASEAGSKPVATANPKKQAVFDDDDDMDELAIPTITEVPLPPSVAKAAASAAESKPEPPKTRTRKVVATVTSTSTPAPKAAAPKTAAPKTASSRTASSKTASSKAAASKAEGPKAEDPKTAPKTAAKADAPKTAAAKAAAPVAASTRRSTRSTRLQTPTPMKKVVSAESTTAPKRAIPSRAKTALPKPAASTSTAATTAAAPAAAPASGIKKAAGRPTKRTDVAKLGMTVNGTPAPKRRGRPAASSS